MGRSLVHTAMKCCLLKSFYYMKIILTAGQFCPQRYLMNNGDCNQEIMGDYSCLFDYPDCTDDLRREVQCSFAVQQSYISCDIAIEMHLKYPTCQGIHICCSDLRYLDILHEIV